MPPANPIHLKQISRFLHVGLEENKYFPGCWSSHKYFELSKLGVMGDFLIDGECQAVIDIIVKTYQDGLFTRYDTIAFAACKLLKVSNSEAMLTKVYNMVPLICKTPMELITFVNYCAKFRVGCGHGYRRTILSWYMSKAPMELAADVMRVKGFYGRKHSQIIRKAHVKLPEGDIARDAIIKYLMYGLKQSRVLLADKPEAAPVLEYVQRVEELRHCEDASAAAIIARDNNFTLEHLPGHLLTSQKLWDAVLPNMGLQQLLSNLVRIHNLGFFTAESATTAIVVSMLTNPDYVRNSGVGPLAIHIALCCYNCKRVPMKYDKMKKMEEKKDRRRQRQHFDAETQQWQWDCSRPRHPKEHKYWGADTPQNPEIQKALLKARDLSWPKFNKNSTVRYLITMDLREHMFLGRHFCTTGFKPPKNEQKKEKRLEVRAVRAMLAKTSSSSRTNAATARAPVAAPRTNVPTNAAGSSSVSTDGAAGDSATNSENKTTRGNKHKASECFHHKSVTPGDAALMLALTLYKRERHARLAVFTEEGLQLVELPKDRRTITFERAKAKLMAVKLGRVKVEAPIEWANKTKYPVDVFINIIDRQSRYNELAEVDRDGRGLGGQYGLPPPPGKVDHCPVRALERYRLRQNLPQARLITMSLATHKVNTATSDHHGVLDIIGIDEHVPKLIDAFAAAAFD